jgi:serine/threonine-protein kinase
VSLVEGDVVVRAEARVGNVLRGKYRLERVLGVGGMAAVYAATHRNSKRFAIKVLHPELSLQSDIRVRFLREGYAATQVGHPGAVAVLDDDVAEDGSAFLVMELLEGVSIDALWERCRWKMPAGAVLAIAHQLLDVLAAAHDNGIVHRDIKPENLFLTDDGQVKVLDFGIARLKGTAHGSSVTGTGFVMGTPAFMAPEQALGKSSEINAQSDLWSAGAVLFTLLSGHFVHEGESPQAIVVQCATEPARSLLEGLPGAPREVVELVDSALAFKKSARWPTAIAMKKGVEAAAVAVLGTGPSRSALLRLLAETPAGGDRTSDGPDLQTIARPSRKDAQSTGQDDGASPAGASAATQAEAVPEIPRRIGLITEQPVAGDSAATPRSGARRKMVWLGAVGAAAVVLIGIVAAHGRHDPDTSRASISAAPPAVSAPGAVETRAAPAARPPPTTDSIPVMELPVAASAVPAPAPAAPVPAAHPNAGVVHAAAAPPPAPVPAVPTAVAPPATPAANQGNCTPPFTVDPATGKKKWKAECL